MPPKQKFNQSSLLIHNSFNNLFPTVQETNHFMYGGGVVEKNEINGDVPVSEIHFVQPKKCVDFFRNALDF